MKPFKIKSKYNNEEFIVVGYSAGAFITVKKEDHTFHLKNSNNLCENYVYAGWV